MNSKILIFTIIFLLGCYYIYSTCKNVTEPFDTNSILTDTKNILTKKCPNILIQKGSALFLHNSTKAKIPGINPIRFNHLEDYVQFINWQRSQGIRCPILFLQESYDTQGNMVYRVRPSPLALQGGLPGTLPMGSVKAPTSKLIDASHDLPLNKNTQASFDSHNQYIGIYTPLDKIYHENSPPGFAYSASAMDPNWGGLKYSKKMVKKGFYDKDKVAKEVDAE
jgi:hypothetical protein